MTDREVYKGYLIVQVLDAAWHVNKDGFHITTQHTLALAKKQVDAIVDRENSYRERM